MLLSKRWFVLNGDTVVNHIVWDGSSGWSPPEGHTLVAEEEGSEVNVGWRLVNGEWIAPPEPEPLPVDDV
jgi:hypothetical protein